MDWTGARYGDQPTVEVRVHVDAQPGEVWTVVSDPLLMVEFSDEIQGVEWLDGRTSPAVGARFEGHSSHPSFGEWSTVSSVIECDPPRRFAWAVGDPADPSATWRFEIEPEGSGSRLSQWMRMGPARSGLNFAIDSMPDKEQKIVFVRLREHETNMKKTVDGIKKRVEASARP